ncbi:MAG: amidohydrolase family protein [Proteobacteria bacterium]|nr:amidohydrolase family protein [Pseudomonadota bacterium]
MLIRNAELNGRIITLRCEYGLVSEIGDSLVSQANETLIDAGGGAILPGLHDHHIHLHALAAAKSSVICGPPQVANIEQLERALKAQAGSGWIRGIAYHDSVAGELNCHVLDKLVSDRPVRIQHRSGKMWIVNSMAAQLLELEKYTSRSGIECDGEGRPNGRLFRLDEWMRTKMASKGPPDVAQVSRQLASYGVTGLTDATPGNSVEEMQLFGRAIDENRLLQRVLLMGDMALPASSHRYLERGAYKILLDEMQLPNVEELVEAIRSAHEDRRAVAIHCVTRTEIVFALSSLITAGHHRGDRIEHASIAPDEVLPLMREAQVCVVTQHGFLRERGDQYLADVELRDQQFLYRGKAFLAAGIPLAGSSDAPYGSHDPWLTMHTAVERSSAGGKCMGIHERLTPEQALALFTTCAGIPGSSPRKVALGEVADLCLLDCSWSVARTRLDCRNVLATLRDGELIYCR